MSQTYTLADVAKHAVEGDLWMVIHDKVYDVSKYADLHPGGSIIMVRHPPAAPQLLGVRVGYVSGRASRLIHGGWRRAGGGRQGRHGAV